MKLLKRLNKKGEVKKMTFEELRKRLRKAGFKQDFYDEIPPIGIFEIYQRGYFSVAISKESDSRIYLSISHKHKSKLDRAKQLLDELCISASLRNYGQHMILFLITNFH